MKLPITNKLNATVSAKDLKDQITELLDSQYCVDNQDVLIILYKLASYIDRLEESRAIYLENIIHDLSSI